MAPPAWAMKEEEQEEDGSNKRARKREREPDEDNLWKNTDTMRENKERYTEYKRGRETML